MLLDKQRHFYRLAHDKGFHPVRDHERWQGVKGGDVTHYKVFFGLLLCCASKASDQLQARGDIHY